ncbi:TIGR03086 family protein [Streptomyces adustus]|uniref:TIGR03086 family protein n=1 Tax=Streptomyces adustus TaxID=1609272 RepID=A0A5N8VPX1_9ACTN|nr:maleylpyruvate isomerase N-terminal domain-containing protein [Streptomyces adustus]MPY37327.1 TIGR03086 family protein [Streptomyces adustus]
MTEFHGVQVLTLAHDYLREVVAAVPEGARAAPTPCSAWSVRQVLDHARIDQQAHGLVLTGGRPDSDPFPAEGLPRRGPGGGTRQGAGRGRDRPEPATSGWPRRGGPAPADRLVNHLRDAYQVFAPAKEIHEDHTAAEALPAFLGRDPRWAPSAG